MKLTTVSRRTTLAMLGLAPATAVGAETFLDPPMKTDRPNIGNDANQGTIANALRQLADNIIAGKVAVGGLNLHTNIRRDEVVVHELMVEFVHKPEAGGSA